MFRYLSTRRHPQSWAFQHDAWRHFVTAFYRLCPGNNRRNVQTGAKLMPQ